MHLKSAFVTLPVNKCRQLSLETSADEGIWGDEDSEWTKPSENNNPKRSVEKPALACSVVASKVSESQNASKVNTEGQQPVEVTSELSSATVSIKIKL
jgi:hypothetical protein